MLVWAVLGRIWEVEASIVVASPEPAWALTVALKGEVPVVDVSVPTWVEGPWELALELSRMLALTANPAVLPDPQSFFQKVFDSVDCRPCVLSGTMLPCMLSYRTICPSSSFL